jgi:hypothetical protein
MAVKPYLSRLVAIFRGNRDNQLCILYLFIHYFMNNPQAIHRIRDRQQQRKKTRASRPSLASTTTAMASTATASTGPARADRHGPEADPGVEGVNRRPGGSNRDWDSARSGTEAEIASPPRNPSPRGLKNGHGARVGRDPHDPRRD